jgi:hypothetical protein
MYTTGLFNECFPPVTDGRGISLTVRNYACRLNRRAIPDNLRPGSAAFCRIEYFGKHFPVMGNIINTERCADAGETIL